MGKTILVVDDKEQLRTLVKTYLTVEGFRVVTAVDGREALFVARQEKPDLIILDLMMPQMSGYEFLNAHRKERETPVIMLTAKVEEADRVLGLELGADDYVTKPFSMRELAARVRAVLRRMDKEKTESPRLQNGELMLDRESRTATVAGTEVDLTPSEFGLLAALLSNPGRVFSRSELLERIQGDAYEGYERTIDVHIRNLRAKIEREGAPRQIETVYGVGYRLRGE
ncbi:MAG: response regulator transcription factor [Caldilineaceae bacterium]|nr:response regulator transcription factor [Caldilineaceae bacterium]